MQTPFPLYSLYSPFTVLLAWPPAFPFEKLPKLTAGPHGLTSVSWPLTAESPNAAPRLPIEKKEQQVK